MLAAGKKLSEGLRTSWSSTRTTPVMTRACVFVRDCASPRSTSSLSMRSRSIARHRIRSPTVAGSPRGQPAWGGRQGGLDWLRASLVTGAPYRSGLRTLAPRALHHRARGIADMQLSCALDAQPHHDSPRIHPTERTNLSGDLHGV